MVAIVSNHQDTLDKNYPVIQWKRSSVDNNNNNNVYSYSYCSTHNVLDCWFSNSMAVQCTNYIYWQHTVCPYNRAYSLMCQRS